MKTALIKISLFFLLLHSVGASFVLASNQTPASTSHTQLKCEETPAVCIATPDSMNLYLDFQREMIAVLKANPFETVTETIERPDWWLFVNQLLKLADPSMATENLLTRSINGLGISAEKVLMANLTTIALFEMSVVTAIFDGMMWFLILGQERPFVRDYKKLLEIEREYSLRARELGEQMLITKKIKNTAPLQAIIQKYQDKGLLVAKSQFPASLHYYDVILDLMKLNVDMKLFLGSTSKAQFSLRVQQQNEASLYLGFHEKWIEQLEKDYLCVWLGFRCNQPLKNFWAEMKHLRKTSSRASKSAFNTIKLSINRLNEALLGTKMYFKDKEKSLTAYEKELLRARDGNLTRNDNAYLFSFSERMKNQWREAKIQRPTKDDQKKPSLAKEFENAQKLRLTTLSNSYRQQDLYLALQSGFLKFAEQHDAILQTTQLGDSLVVCREFGALAAQIQEIAKVVWDKSNGVRGQVYNVCSYQCSNKAALECYTQ